VLVSYQPIRNDHERSRSNIGRKQGGGVGLAVAPYGGP
jgi:hypothetical protein